MNSTMMCILRAKEGTAGRQKEKWPRDENGAAAVGVNRRGKNSDVSRLLACHSRHV
ncbi:hypothetical protein PUN28_012028 [Cardiocondyla obscurior]|uniref:Uncharacterized protein n=1 Tax=Cardiocondyla obscurior TaxID=286306 RepID=A0AAW2FE17_9HYME